jgi:hypothetical protein
MIYMKNINKFHNMKFYKENDYIQKYIKEGKVLISNNTHYFLFEENKKFRFNVDENCMLKPFTTLGYDSFNHFVKI